MKKNSPFVIAVDGPAAAGKGTLTRGLAARLAYERLDSGRLYRSVARHVADEWQEFSTDSQNSNLDIPDIAQAVSTRLPLTRAYLAELGKDRRLDKDKIALLASRLAPHAALRAVLRDQQRAYIAAVATGIVLDGRDMGTVVCPEASCKIFLTASLEARAARRAQEMLDQEMLDQEMLDQEMLDQASKQSYTLLLNEVLQAMRLRDERDVSRSEAPLKAAEDAMILDSSALSVEQVLKQALDYVEACRTRFFS